MSIFKRVLCVVLSLVILMQLLSGCTSEKTDETLYITKGEFFTYYVYENSMTSARYTAEDIQNCDDGSVEADIIVQWGYLPEELAKKGLDKPVEKEIVVMVCANATFDMKKGDVSEIKDADLLNDPQLIADAYASGFFDLENGYFDGAKKMSLADCDEIMNRANEYTANFHYEANTEKTETAEGVKEQDSSNYSDGDIVIEFFNDETASETESSVVPEELSSNANNNTAPRLECLDAKSDTAQASTLETKPTAVEKAQLANDIPKFVGRDQTGFVATIKKDTFEHALKNPQIGDTVVLNRAQAKSEEFFKTLTGEIIGVLESKKLKGSDYECRFSIPDFDEAVQSKNVTEANGSGIGTDSFTKLESEVAGWKLKFNPTKDSISIEATKEFTVQKSDRKQEWQNAKKSVTAKANCKISDFNVDVNNLKSFSNKKGKGYIKITCDTDVDFSLDTSLRYTPDSNRKGKFPSNWNTSRWTDKDAKGAKAIKIAKFSPSLYGIVGIEVNVYLLVTMDGKISFATSIDGGGVQLTANNGEISITKLGNKTTEANVDANARARIGVDASIKIFNCINVIRYDVGGNFNLHAVVNLYYEKQLSKSGVYADEEGLTEYEAADNKFEYCVGIGIKVSVSGELKDCGVKMILDCFSKGTALNFEKEVWSGGLHFEDGHFVDECTRGGDMTEMLKESENDDVELEAYKSILDEGESVVVALKAIPSETMDLLNSKNSITVESKNEKVCTATYNKKGKYIIIEAVGEGSTEVVIKAKRGKLWWKKSCEQKISVTVNKPTGGEAQEVEYIIIDPCSAVNLCRV